MREYINKLRARDESYRKQALAIWMAISVVFVVSVWIYSLGGKFNSQNTAKVEQSVKPFKLFANSISETYKNISASVGNIPSLKKEVKKDEKVIDLIPVEKGM